MRTEEIRLVHSNMSRNVVKKSVTKDNSHVKLCGKSSENNNKSAEKKTKIKRKLYGDENIMTEVTAVLCPMMDKRRSRRDMWNMREERGVESNHRKFEREDSRPQRIKGCGDWEADYSEVD